MYLLSTNYNFTEYSNTLSELEQFCIQQKSYGFIPILLGDFNAHLLETNLHQRLNKRGLKLHEFCASLNLTTVNISVCKNPQFTYYSRSGNSIVDYVIIDDVLLELLEFVERSCKHPDNTVFHLPLKICLSDKDFNRILNDTEDQGYSPQDKISWKRCTVEQLNSYQEHLNSIWSSVLREEYFPDVNIFMRSC